MHERRAGSKVVWLHCLRSLRLLLTLDPKGKLFFAFLLLTLSYSTVTLPQHPDSVPIDLSEPAFLTWFVLLILSC